MIRTTPDQYPRLSEILIEALVCPRDQGDLEQVGQELICLECGVRYRITNGVPDMLVDPE
jgi:uncharacterized protein YbaR (Trm112 family)